MEIETIRDVFYNVFIRLVVVSTNVVDLKTIMKIYTVNDILELT